jgi:signal transduction histidine kinase
MRLVLRVTLWIFFFLTVASSAIGYFAIDRYHSSLIQTIDDSLNSKVKALSVSKEDPLTVAQYLAQVSAIPVTVQYRTETGLVTVLTVAGPTISSTPPALLRTQGMQGPVNDGKDLRIRTFQIVGGKELIFVESTATINTDVKNLTRDLILFILAIDLLAGLVAFLVFRRDGKLNQVSRLIEEQKRAMQKFMGDASHELRTPLTVIKGYVDLARATTDPVKEKDYLEKSAAQIFRMESIIQDLLFLAEVGEGESDQVEEVDLGPIVRDHVEVLEALQPTRSVKITQESRVLVSADRKLIDRAVANIFSNIRRHTPEEAKVLVSLSQVGEKGKLVIEDGGPGLSEYPEKAKALKRFTEQRSAEGGGSGLGLSIISSVVDRYGGSLHLTKSRLGGLRIEITLPSQSSKSDSENLPGSAIL